MTTLLNSVISRFKAYSRYRHVRAELSRLTDKDLSDIGIGRGDIERIAKESQMKYRQRLLAS